MRQGEKAAAQSQYMLAADAADRIPDKALAEELLRRAEKAHPQAGAFPRRRIAELRKDRP